MRFCSSSRLLACVVMGLLHATPASAQFGNLLNSLKSAVDARRPASNAPAEVPAAPGQTPPAVTAAPVPAAAQPLTAESYCERITTHPAIVRLSTAMASMGEPALGVRHTWFDNDKGDLERAVADKFRALFSNPNAGMLSPEGQALVLRAEQYVNACVAQKARTPFLTLAGRFLDRRFDGWYAGEVQKAETDRNYKAIDIRGYSFTQALRNGRLSTTGPAPREATLLVFLFPDYEDLIARASPDPGASFMAAAEESRQQMAQQEAERAREAAARKAAEDAEAAKAAARRAFDQSPEGQLLYAYQYFQVIQVCQDVRKGNAIQFINMADFNAYRARMREIENRLKPQLKNKDTDRLWAQAEQRNRRFDLTLGMGGDNPPTVDLLETIRSNNNGRWMAAKEDCDAMVNRFRAHADEVLGRESVRKNF